MPIVMKFGGSSLQDAEKIKNAARRVLERTAQGKQVVAVVSAQGDFTDHLVQKAKEVSKGGQGRESDALLAAGEQISAALLAMALEQMGQAAVSLTGWQAGVMTEDDHGPARIIGIDDGRIRRELASGRVVVVTGFQGINSRGDMTTIGRGGSDTSAVALAAALNAEDCLIFTDVSGVYSADPRAVPQAVRHQTLPWDQMLELADMGAQVLHGRAVRLARARQVPVTVLSSFEATPGTRLVAEPGDAGVATAVTCDKGFICVRVRREAGLRPCSLLSALTQMGAAVDSLWQSGDQLIFLLREQLSQGEPPNAEAIRRALLLPTVQVEFVGRVSLIGQDLNTAPAMASRMLSALVRSGMQPIALQTGPRRVSAIVPVSVCALAVQAAHTEFFPGEEAETPPQV